MDELTKKVLVWVNHKREEFELEPLEKLRKGSKDVCLNCPLANSLTEEDVMDAWFGKRNWSLKLYKWAAIRSQRLPAYVERWIRDFDNGIYSQYYKRELY